MPNSKIKKRAEADNIVSVVTAVKDFLADPGVKKLSVRTQEEYTANLTTFAKWCSEHSLHQDKAHRSWSAIKVRANHYPIQLHQINDLVVSLFLDYIRGTRKPSKSSNTELSTHTLVQYVKDIKRFLNWCILDDVYYEHVNATSVARIQKPKLEEFIIDVFSDEDIEAIFRACDKEVYEHLQVRDKAIVALLLDTGLRATELCTLTIGNVSLDSKDAYVRVLGKGRKWGEVSLGDRARRSLSKYFRTFREPTIEAEVARLHKNVPARQLAQLTRQHMQSARFFVNRAGQPMTRSGLQQLMTRLGEWAGVDTIRCSPHTFRHTFSCLFMRNGGNIYTLSKLLRHSSVKVTEEYLKALKQSEVRRNAKSVLDNLQ